jgi:tetratricopeptide (TPR) repeat protein
MDTNNFGGQRRWRLGGLFAVGAISTAVYKLWKLLFRKPPTEKIKDESDIAKDALYLARQFVEASKEKQRDLETENSQLREALAGQDAQAEKALTDAIEGLAEDAENTEDRAPFDKALAELAEGRPDAAENLFTEILDRRKAEGQAALKEAAEAVRNIGAIAFYHDTQKALTAYVQATEMDPDDAEAWNQLGHLQYRVGNLAAAETAYQNVLRLGNSLEDKTLLAVAYGNLGNVFRTRGDLDAAEDMFRKSLALNEAPGRKESMANQYGNLGNVLRTRGGP